MVGNPKERDTHLCLRFFQNNLVNPKIALTNLLKYMTPKIITKPPTNLLKYVTPKNITKPPKVCDSVTPISNKCIFLEKDNFLRIQVCNSVVGMSWNTTENY